MYRIIGSDQKEYGPVSADEIRQWIATRRVVAHTRAQAEGSSEWKPLSEFPEFADALKSAQPSSQPPSVPPSSPGFPPPPSRGYSQSAPSSALAVTSLVLGILSFFLCSIFSGIPAIIAGHIAHNRARRQPGQYGGGSMAIAGFVLGYISLVFIPIMAGLMLPALAKAKHRAQTINCVSNMKQIGLAARMWANDHSETFPPDFLSMSNELVSPKVLACPGDDAVAKTQTWEGIGSGNISYEYLTPGISEAAALQTVVFRCPIHNNIGYGDGSVQQKGGR